MPGSTTLVTGARCQAYIEKEEGEVILIRNCQAPSPSTLNSQASSICLHATSTSGLPTDSISEMADSNISVPAES